MSSCPALRLGLAMMLVAVASSSALARWSFDEIEGGHKIQHSSMVLDPTGRPVIAYSAGDPGGQSGKGELHLAGWTGSQWLIQEVDVEGCQYAQPSVAVDAAGRPAVSYFDALERDLKLARWDGSAWRTEVVAGTGRQAGYGNSLALDASGNPVISYHDDSSGRLKLARWDGTAWAIQTVDAANEDSSLALDASGHPAIAYTSGAFLRFARWDGSGWDIESVTSVISSNPQLSLALDASDHPVIAFVDSGLKLARWDGVSWNIESTGPWDARHPSLALDASGHPVISSYIFDGSMQLTRWNGSTWERQVIEVPGRVSWYTSVALDAAGDVFVNYVDMDNGHLKLAVWDGSAWGVETVRGSADPWGGSPVFDSSGNPWVVYYDASGADLKLAHWAGGVWVIEEVATERGSYSLALDAADHPLVAYTAADDYELWFARWDGTAWNREKVDAGGSFGMQGVYLILDPDGHPAMCYQFGIGGELRLARWDGSAWNIETVDDHETTGTHCELVFDQDDRPAIVYDEGDAVTFKLARWHGTAWRYEFPDPRPDSQRSSLVFDADGNPLISYRYDWRSGDGFNLARWDGSAWNIETIIADENVTCPHNSLVLDPSGKLMLVCNDWSDMSIHLWSWDGSSWVSEYVTDGRAWRLVLDPTGNPVITYRGHDPGDPCNSEGLRITWWRRTAILRRGVVSDLGPGWKAAALPLTEANDDETPPFPVDTEPPGTFVDAEPPQVPLTLYRSLEEGLRAGSPLRVVKQGTTEVLLQF